MSIGKFQQRSRPHFGRPSRKSKRLILERLEDRTVPTGILYQYPSGYAIRYFGGPIIPNVDVDLIFWGSRWENGIGAVEKPNVQDAAGSIVGGPYMSRLAQYGVGNGFLQRSDLVTSTDPVNPYPDPPDDFGIVHIVAMLRNRIALGLLPDPRTDPQRFYYVVTQPGTHLQTGVGEAGGYHDYDISPLDGATHYRFGLGSNPFSTRPGDATNIDWVTSIFSHELVEAATDPEGRTAPGWSRAPFGGAHELCDDEAQLYNYRLGNYLVQSYWSGLDAGSPVVPTGTLQNFFVDNANSRVLTVVGDQVVQNDVARLEVTADGGNKITLNGEVALFDRSLPWWFDQNGFQQPTLNGIIVNTLTGTNAVVVASSNVPIHVNMLNGVNDSLHVGDPGVGLLDAIRAPLWAIGQANAVDVFFHDQAYGGNDTYTFDFNGGLGLYTLTRTGGNQPFFWYDRVRTLSLFTGSGNDTVNVLVTAANTLTTVNAGPGVDTVNVGKNNTLSTIAGGLIVNGQAGGVLTLNLNDRAYAPNNPYTLTNNTLTRAGVAIGYTLVSNFNLNAGTGNNVITIRSVAAGTLYTVDGGAGYDTIEIPQGPVSTNQLQWVDVEALLIDGGTLSIDDNVAIQDLTVTAGTLTGTRTLTITNLARWQGGTTSGTGLFLVINQATWTGGVMNGAGMTAIAVGASLSINANVNLLLDTRTVNNSGTALWTGFGDDITFANGAIFNNQAGATFDAQNNQSLLPGVGAAASFNNSGTVKKSAGNGVTTFGLGQPFNTAGMVFVQNGTLSFTGAYVQQNPGVTVVNAGTTLAAAGGVNIQGGALSGSGTVSANVTNNGQVNPGGMAIGLLTIQGNYMQTPAGALNIKIGGYGAGFGYDQLSVTGQATLAGTLNVSLVFGFMPAVNDAFQVLVSGQRIGTFQNYTGLQFGALHFDPRYDPVSLTLVVVANCGPGLSNGGFETGDFTCWTQSGLMTYSRVTNDNPHTGNFAAHLGEIDGLGFVSQTVATTAGHQYRLTYWLAHNFPNAGTPNRFQVSIGGNIVYDQVDLPVFPYAQFSFNSVAAGPTTTIQFADQENPSWFDLDDVSFDDLGVPPAAPQHDEPSPSSLSPLSLTSRETKDKANDVEVAFFVSWSGGSPGVSLSLASLGPREAPAREIQDLASFSPKGNSASVLPFKRSTQASVVYDVIFFSGFSDDGLVLGGKQSGLDLG